MKAALALCIAAAPAFAQEVAPLPPAAGDGFSLVEEGARLVLRGLMTEMEPALKEMGKALEEVGPAIEGFGAEVGPKIQQLISMIDDFQNYEAPEMLPNGDIIIRRNAPLVSPVLPTPGATGEIDL